MSFKNIGYTLLILLLLGKTGLAAEHRFIKEISFEGLQKINMEQVTANLTLRCKAGELIRELDLELDTNDLYLSGYFSKVEPILTSLNVNTVKLTFKLIENPQINKIELKNFTAIEATELKRIMANKEGLILNIKNLTADRINLEKNYHQKGYDFFKIVRMELNPSNNLIVEAQEGLIDQVTFIGLTNLTPPILNRRITQKKGRIFNSPELRDDRQKLFDLGYFSQVDTQIITTSNLQQADQIGIEFKVKEKKANLVNAGLETDIGENTILAFLQLNFNHFLVPGSLLTAKTQVYTLNKTLSVKSYGIRYYQTWLLPDYPLTGSVGSWKEVDINEKTNTGMDVKLEYPVFTDKMTLVHIASSKKIQPLNNPYYLILSLTNSLSYKSTDSQYNPSSGTYWSLEYEMSNNFGINNPNIINFNKLGFNWAHFIPVSKLDILGLHLFGGIFNLDPNCGYTAFEELPGFTLGGANSLRGFAEETVEKSKKVQLNLEWRHNFTSEWQSVIFLDSGKLVDQNTTFSFDNFSFGYGFGIRYYSPIGPIRLEFAQGQGKFVHLNLGQVF